MANGEEKSNDFYAVLGLKKECTALELRNAYKKQALRWHPDRCSASGNSKFVEEAKKKFQAIQQAYSVLSDENKRFMYDIGVYDSDDDENGMGDFLNEMAFMMNQTKPNESGEETFEELQQLFEDMFQGDNDAFGSSSGSYCESSTTSASSYASYCESSSSTNKRSSTEMNNGIRTNGNDSSGFAAHCQSFCVGTGGTSAGYEGGEGSQRRSSRRSKR
ncbi:DnaJ domain containing protein [Trema orientale]|uniref:DnaJ domain containing protein n=1 Tax=Trema orientale TaxID=63057 RepID=A0A2P5CNG3_TREOI|nr:DnaJ domain containing protein [Trema orientale]